MTEMSIDIASGSTGLFQGGMSYTNGLVGQAFNFNGSNSFLATTIQATNPQSFTLTFWMKSNTTNGGVLIGFGDNQTNNPSSYDRHVYLDNNGKIHFGVYSGGDRTLDSLSAYNDNAWHFVAASLSTSNGTYLYLDGNLVTNSPGTTNIAIYNGWWRIGENNIGGWPYQPTSAYFKGQMDEVSIFNRALSSNEVQSIYYAGGLGMCKIGPSIASVTPASGTIGAVVYITGTNLYGVTNVAFNGVAANFSILSGQAIIATVPTNATTGPLVLAGITGNSQSNFVVISSQICFSPPTGISRLVAG